MIPIKEINLILDFLVDNVPDKWLPNADGIFVFGHVDKRVAQHATKLFLAGKASKMVISGGLRASNKIPDGFLSEAEFFASVIKEAGIFGEALILEKKASNTFENVVFGMRASYNAGFNPKSLILVALPPLLRRSRATFAKQFPDIETFGSAFPIANSEFQDNRRVRRMIEEIDRLKQYAEKGDITASNIPRQVTDAHSIVSSFLK